MGSKDLYESRPKLNVIFHGLFTFKEDDQPEEEERERELTVYIPDLCSEHLYKAGNWLAETTLRRGSDLRLKGVANFRGPRTEVFNSDHNLAIDGAVVSPEISVYATFRLPYPQTPAQSLRRLTIRANGLAGDQTRIERLDGTEEGGPYQSPTVQVLTYDIESDAELGLIQNPYAPPPDAGQHSAKTPNGDHCSEETPYAGHPWEPVFEDGYVNLHIFSEPESPSTEDHIKFAFRESMRLLGSDLELVRPPEPADLKAEILQGVLTRRALRGEVLPGVHEIELQDLIGRNRWLAVLGRAIKGYRDINYIWEDPTAFSGSDPDTCTGCNVGS